MNTNPNNPTTVPSKMLLPSIMLTAAHYVQFNAGTVVCDLWVQHLKATTYMDEDRYKARADRMSTVWSNLYAGAFEDCIQVDKLAEKEKRPNHQAIALVMKAYIGYNLTTIYGDVPYTSAGLGEQGQIQPTYEKQQAVLNSCITDLNAAIAKMDPNDANLGEIATSDLIYRGKMDLWEKFANSLKVRIYLTLTAGGVDKKAEINALLAGGKVFQSGSDDAKLNYFSSPTTNSNPVWQWCNPTSDRKDDYRMSSTICDYMRGSSVDSANPTDARLKIYADGVISGSFKGKYIGSKNGTTGGQNTTSRVGSQFYSPSSPFYFISYSELLFIQAELDTTDQTKYSDAVTASFIQNGLTSTEANLVLNDPKFKWNPAIGGRLVGEQKWVSLYGQGVEAFNSWRRLGYPKFTKASSGATTYVPRRMAYNSDEVSLNSANVSTGTQNLVPSADYISSQVWFDQKHGANFGNK